MQWRLSDALKRKLKRMTILVGMVGSDGIILAADQRMTQNAAHEGEFDDYEGIRKIVNLAKYHIAYAGVGDYVTRSAAIKLLERLDTAMFDFADIGPALENIAYAVKDDYAKLHQPINPEEERSLLFVFYGLAEPQLWRLRITPPGIAAQHIYGMCIRGALGNRARFFDYYFKEYVPVDKLKFLAAHIVLSAGRSDPVMIQGLDIALFNGSVCRFLTENEKQDLRDRSERLDALIRKELFA